MIELEGVKGALPKERNYQNLSEGQFLTLPGHLLLEIFQMIGNQHLSKLSLVCRLFRHMSYDPHLIQEDVETAVELLEDLFYSMRHGRTHSATLGLLIQSDLSCEVKLLRLTSWIKRLIGELPFETMIAWAPPSHFSEGSQRMQYFVNRIYAKRWKEYINEEIATCKGINLGCVFRDDAFDQCLKKMREIDFIPCLFVSYALSRQQVALLSEQLEAKAVKAGRLSFYDRPPMDSLKRNRLLEAVSQCSCFTELNFYSGSLRDDDIVLLASLFQKHPSICKITMNGFALSRAGVGQLLKLYRDSPSLTSLGMFGCSDHEMKELIEKLQGNSIQDLGIACQKITEEIEALLIKKFSRKATVQRLSISHNGSCAREIFKRIEEGVKTSLFYKAVRRGDHQLILLKR